MPPEYPQQYPNQYTLLRRLVVVAAVLFLVVLLLRAFWPKPHFDTLYLTDTGLERNLNFAELRGNALYSYNGMAFVERTVGDNPKIKVLNHGVRLPKPTQLYWANDKGALMTFKESFYYSRVHDTLRANNKPLNESTRSYTWYFEFATGKLSVVNSQPPRPDAVVYADSEEGFYYSPQPDRDGHGELGRIPLRFFDINTKRNRVVSSNLAVTDLGSLHICQPDQYQVCYIARDLNDTSSQRLYGIDKNQQTKELINHGGRLFSMGSEQHVLGIKQIDNKAKPSDGDHELSEEADLANEPVDFLSLGGEPKSLNQKVGLTGLDAQFRTKDEFVVFSDSFNERQGEDDSTQYLAGRVGNKLQTRLMPLRFVDDSIFSRGLIGFNGKSDNGALLLTDAADQQLFMAPKNIGMNSRASLETVEAALSECVKQHARHSQYFEDERLFKVYVLLNRDSYANMKRFAACMAEKSETLMGYNYHLGLVDSAGTIASD